MSLKSLKKKINLDQRNLLQAIVIATGDRQITVRTSDGSQRRIAVTSGSDYGVGSQIQVSTDGSTWAVTADSTLAALGGELIVKL